MVNTHFWRDGYVQSLRPDERLLFLWAITNPATDLCGAYEAPLPIIELETGLKRKRVVEIFEKFLMDNKVIYRRGWVIVRNFAKHQQGNSPKVAEGVRRSLSACPDWIKDTLRNGIDTLCIPTRTLTLTSRENPNSDGGDEPEEKKKELPPYLPGSSIVKKDGYARSTAAVNANAQLQLEEWLDAVAPKLGAMNRSTIADFRGWETTCIKAISDGVALGDFLDVVDSEQDRLRDTPQFFTPVSVLKIIQSKKVRPTVSKFIH